MKIVPASALATPMLCGLLLLAGIPTAKPDSMMVPSGGVDFVLSHYDDGRPEPLEAAFTVVSLASLYQFDVGGRVVFITAGAVVWKVRYNTSGKVRDVKKVSVRRHLGEEESEEGDAAGTALVGEIAPGVKAVVDETALGGMAVVGDTTPAAHGTSRVGSRRLMECDECHETYDMVCDEGVRTVCELVADADPILAEGYDSISLFCNDFGNVCGERTADDVCGEECVDVNSDIACLPPLTIKLEWREGSEPSDASISSTAGAYVDLYVIEPTGQTAHFHNSITDTGYLLETSDNALTYTMRNGLDVESALGYFIAFAELSEGTPPVFWTMKATIGDGEVMFEEDGVFTDDCDASGSSDSGVSRLIWGDLVEYHDNGCEENFR